MDIRTPADWLSYARKNLGEPGTEPFVFVSWASKDRETVERALPFVKTRFEHLKCPATGAPYRVEHFMDVKHGTKQGEFFPEKIARWMWNCRGAILMWSQNFLDSDWGRQLEAPSLVWRWKQHRLPLFVIRVGPTSPSSQNISVTLDDDERVVVNCDLALLTDDRNPRENASGSNGKFLPQLDDTDFGLRMVSISESYVDAIAQRWHIASPPASVMLPVESPSPRPTAAEFIVKWCGDFSSGQSSGKVFGREVEYAQLTRYARDREVGVITVTALGGQGKTALVRSWIESSPRESLGRDFESCFAFCFDHGHGQDEFANELACFLDPEKLRPNPKEPSPWDLLERLRERKVLLFLDGLEVIQMEERQNEKEGRVEQGPVLNLLFGLCQEIRKCRSLAIVTSRLHLLGFEDYEHSSLRILDLGGLSEEAGNELLKNLGVRQASDAKREEYCRDLAGHPLLLRVFADAVRRRGGSLSFGNAAEKIAEEMRIAEPGEFKDKLKRVVASYRKELGSLEQGVIAAVAVFGGSSTLEYIRSYMRQRDEAPTDVDVHLIARPLQELTEAGILTLREESARRLYSCHPSLREGFAPDHAGARLAARISIYSRPAPMRPRSLAEAEPYLRAIRIHADAGDFKEAHAILGRHLAFGDIFDTFYGGQRALLECLKEFLGPKRRDTCEGALGRGFMIATIPRLVMTAIDLGEWEDAAQYSEWDKKLLESEGQQADALSVGLLAQIAAETGEAEDARSLYRRAIDLASPGERGRLILDLAELERQLGATEFALRLVVQWISQENSASSWILGWNDALRVVQYALKRSHPEVAARCQEARAAVMKMTPKPAPTLEKYIEYERLSLKPRAACTQEDWREKLRLGDELTASAKDYGDRAEGGWPIARAEALSALGRASEAEATVRLAVCRFPAKSWRRLWFGVEIARAYLLQGKIDKGADEARRIMRASYARERMLITRDASELILEFAAQISNRSIISEAQRYLDRVTLRQRVQDTEIPELGPMPGEMGWDVRVSQYILRQLRPEQRDEVPTQEELNSAMVLAAEIGSSDAIIELHRVGASPLAIDARGVSALAAAAKAGHERALDVLLKRRAPYDPENQQDLAAAVEAIGADQIGALRLLLRNSGGKWSDSLNALLHSAAMIGSGQAIEELCKAGADPAALNGDLHPVVRAARSGNLDALAALARRVRDINRAVDADGETALMAAMGAGHETVVSWLLDGDTDIDARDNAGRTAAEYAIERGQTGALDVLRAIKRRDALADFKPVNIAIRAAAGNHIELLKRAVARGASMKDTDQQGRTPLISAALAGHLDVIRMICELEPDISIDAPSPLGWTAIMAAAEVGHNDLVTALHKEFGARLDIVDKGGWDALDHALFMGKAETIHLLASLGANPRNNAAAAEVVALAASRKHRDALAAYLTVVKEGGFLDQIGANLLPKSVPIPADPELAADLLIHIHTCRDASERLIIPARSLEELSEEELAVQPCVYMEEGATTYASLPISLAPTALIERFLSQQLRTQFTNLDAFDLSRLRHFEATWLGGTVAFLPHREHSFYVPFFISEDGVQIAERTNEWIYSRMGGHLPPQPDQTLMAYVRFFFTTIVGSAGAFRIAESIDDALWLPSAPYAIKCQVAEKLQPLKFLTPRADGLPQLRGTVFFKNALFVTSIVMTSDWTTELIDEELLMEDLPVFFGLKFDLLVRK